MAQNAPAAFHDITVGNNMVPCTAGTTNCASGGEIGFSATPGYDEASGLGSVDAYNLVMEWPGQREPARSELERAAEWCNGAIAFARLRMVAGDEQQWLRHHDRAESRRADYHSFDKHLRRSMHGCHDLGESEHLHPVVRSGGGDLLLGRAGSPPASGSGHGAWSSIFSFTTTGGSLSAPTLSAPVNGATAVNLPTNFSWISVSGNGGTHHRLRRARSASLFDPDGGRT